jgi:predicted nucleic acid-binding protein
MLLDTSAVIAISERRNERVLDLVRGRGTYSIGSVFVTGELRHGVEVGSGDTQRDVLRRATLALYQQMTKMPAVLDLAALADRYGLVSAQATREGMRIGQNDRWIIAEAAGHGVTLVTCDAVQAALMSAYRTGEVLDYDAVVLVD